MLAGKMKSGKGEEEKSKEEVKKERKNRIKFGKGRRKATTGGKSMCLHRAHWHQNMCARQKVKKWLVSALPHTTQTERRVNKALAKLVRQGCQKRAKNPCADCHQSDVVENVLQQCWQA
jgi:hypothetical protein